MDYSTANSVTKEADATNSGFKHAVASPADVSPLSSASTIYQRLVRRGLCSPTNGDIDPWGVCYNCETKLLEINNSTLTPKGFALFYKYMAFYTFGNRDYHNGVCYVAKLLLNNTPVMCASSRDECSNEKGIAYFKRCIDNRCTCLIDEAYAPTDDELNKFETLDLLSLLQFTSDDNDRLSIYCDC